MNLCYAGCLGGRHILSNHRSPTTGNHLSARLNEGRWIVPHIISVPLNEVFRVMDDPWMVRRHVVRYEIKDKLEPPLGKFSPGNSKTFPTAQVFVTQVLAYTIKSQGFCISGSIPEAKPRY